MCTAVGSAQHCPFDGTAILVADVRDAETREPIKGLRLTIVDEDGRQVLQKKQEYIGSEFIEAPLVFCENPARTDPDWRPYEFKKIRYSFAGDNYILPVARHHGEAARLIKVEDVDGEANGRYLCGLHVVKAGDYFDLHGNVGWPKIRNQPETLPPSEEFHHTILILLERAKAAPNRCRPGEAALLSQPPIGYIAQGLGIEPERAGQDAGWELGSRGQETAG
jgi:hypothetical protein